MGKWRAVVIAVMNLAGSIKCWVNYQLHTQLAAPLVVPSSTELVIRVYKFPLMKLYSSLQFHHE
jgi:hypothetical protein